MVALKIRNGSDYALGIRQETHNMGNNAPPNYSNK